LSVAGYLLGERWEIISNLLERYESLTIVLICLSIVGYVLYGLLKKRMVKS
jgi:membrane protein DedA with SNARE-associated domain